MTVTEIPSQLGSGVRQLRISIFSTDLASFTTAGAKTFNILGVGGFSTGSGSNPGTLVIPQSGKILGVQQHLITSFSGGALSAMTSSIGKSGGSATAVTAPFDIFQAAGDTVVQETGLFYSGQKSSWTVNVTFTPTGDVLSNCTAGQVDIFIVYLSVSDPTA